MRCNGHLRMRIGRQHVWHDLTDALSQGIGSLLGSANLFQQRGPTEMDILFQARQPVGK